MEVTSFKGNNLEISELPMDDHDFKPEFISTPIKMDNFVIKSKPISSKNFSEVFENCYASKNIPKHPEKSENCNKANCQLKYQSQVLKSMKELSDSGFSNSSNENKTVSEKVKKIVEQLWNDDIPDKPNVNTENENNEKINNSKVKCDFDSSLKVESSKENDHTTSKYDKSTQTHMHPSGICAYKHSKIHKIKDMARVLKKLKYGISKHGCNFQEISKHLFRMEKIRPVDLYIIFRKHIVKY